MSNVPSKSFSDLQAGDYVLDQNGQPVEIVEIHEEYLPEEIFELEFDTGLKIKASGNHLWYFETENDLLAHVTRVKNAKKLLKNLPKEVETGLFDLAVSDEVFVITLDEALEIFDFIEDEVAAFHLVSRVCSSIGPVSEESVSQQDLNTGEMIVGSPVKMFDGSMFSQQVLALTRKKKYLKKWKVIRGRVASTAEIVDRYPDAKIPEPSLQK